MSGKKFAALALGLGVVAFAALALMLGGSTSREPAGASAPAGSDALVRAHSPIKGRADAPVTIVEFLDPECESCRAMYPIVESILAEYAGRVRLVVRYVPLHSSSVLAAASLEEARELGKYEEALEVLFAKQPTWGSHHDPRPELIAQYLADIGIDPARLRAEVVIPKHRSKIEQDAADAAALGVSRTPVLFVNGARLATLGYGPLRRAVEAALSASQPS